MEIDSIRHKGLRRYFETGNPKGLVGDVARIRRMLAFIVAAGTLDELSVPPNYGLHALTGDRAGTWAMTVTRNWRMTFKIKMTFKINEHDGVDDLDLEDYHGA